MNIEARDQRQEALAGESLASKELGAAHERVLSRGVRIRPRPPDRVEDREGPDVGHLGQCCLGAVDPLDRRRRPGVVGLEHEQHELRLRKDRLKRAGRRVVGIVGDDQPIDRAFGRNVCREHGRGGHEERVEDEDDVPKPDDPGQHAQHQIGGH